MGGAFMAVHRAPVILAAARNNVPAVYNFFAFARDGGLLSYGPDQVDTYRRAATYVNDGLKLVENQRSEIGGRRGLTG